MNAYENWGRGWHDSRLLLPEPEGPAHRIEYPPANGFGLQSARGDARSEEAMKNRWTRMLVGVLVCVGLAAGLAVAGARSGKALSAPAAVPAGEEDALIQVDQTLIGAVTKGDKAAVN